MSNVRHALLHFYLSVIKLIFVMANMVCGASIRKNIMVFSQKIRYVTMVQSRYCIGSVRILINGESKNFENWTLRAGNEKSVMK